MFDGKEIELTMLAATLFLVLLSLLTAKWHQPQLSWHNRSGYYRAVRVTTDHYKVERFNPEKKVWEVTATIWGAESLFFSLAASQADYNDDW